MAVSRRLARDHGDVRLDVELQRLSERVVLQPLGYPAFIHVVRGDLEEEVLSVVDLRTRPLKVVDPEEDGRREEPSPLVPVVEKLRRGEAVQVRRCLGVHIRKELLPEERRLRAMDNAIETTLVAHASAGATEGLVDLADRLRRQVVERHARRRMSSAFDSAMRLASFSTVSLSG